MKQIKKDNSRDQQDLLLLTQFPTSNDEKLPEMNNLNDGHLPISV